MLPVFKCVRIPWWCRRISIIADEYVDREFGTGALKITPAHDPNDYEIGKTHMLEVINIMNNDGTLNANAGQYVDLDRAEARSRLWADLEVCVSCPSCSDNKGATLYCSPGCFFLQSCPVDCMPSSSAAFDLLALQVLTAKFVCR